MEAYFKRRLISIESRLELSCVSDFRRCYLKFPTVRMLNEKEGGLNEGGMRCGAQH